MHFIMFYVLNLNNHCKIFSNVTPWNNYSVISYCYLFIYGVNPLPISLLVLHLMLLNWAISARQTHNNAGCRTKTQECNYSISTSQCQKFLNYEWTFSQPDHIPSDESDDQDKLNFAVVTGSVVSPRLGTRRRILAPLCDSPSIMRPRRDRRPWEMKHG